MKPEAPFASGGWWHGLQVKFCLGFSLLALGVSMGINASLAATSALSAELDPQASPHVLPGALSPDAELPADPVPLFLAPTTPRLAPAVQETFDEGMKQRWQAFAEAGDALWGRMAAPAAPRLWQRYFSWPDWRHMPLGIGQRFGVEPQLLGAMFLMCALCGLWLAPRARRAWSRHRTLLALQQAAPYLDPQAESGHAYAAPRWRWRKALLPRQVPGDILIGPAAESAATAEGIDLATLLSELRRLIIILKSAWSAGHAGAWRSTLSDEFAFEIQRQLQEQSARYQFASLNALDVSCQGIERIGVECLLRLQVTGHWQRSPGGIEIPFNEVWNWSALATDTDLPQPWRLVAAVPIGYTERH